MLMDSKLAELNLMEANWSINGFSKLAERLIR